MPYFGRAPSWRLVIILAALAVYRIVCLSILQKSHAVDLTYWTYISYVLILASYLVMLACQSLPVLASIVFDLLMPPLLGLSFFNALGVTTLIYHNSALFTDNAIDNSWSMVYLADGVIHHYSSIELLLLVLAIHPQWRYPSSPLWKLHLLCTFPLVLLFYTSVSGWIELYGIFPSILGSTILGLASALILVQLALFVAITNCGNNIRTPAKIGGDYIRVHCQ